MSAGDLGLLVGLAALLLVGVVLGATIALTKPRPQASTRALTNDERKAIFQRRWALHLAERVVETQLDVQRQQLERARRDEETTVRLRRTYPALALVGRAPKTPGSPNRANVATKDVRALAPRAARGSDAAV